MRIRKLGNTQLSAISAQLAAVLVVVALVGCGGVDQTPSMTDPVAAARIAPEPTRALPEAELPDGSRLTLELALTNEEIGQGLMFRNSLPEDRGMLFIFSQERVPSFWMKNTLIPLDIVFLSHDGVIVDIIKNARPCTSEPCPQYVSKTKVMAVLEVAAGVADNHNLAEGDVLDFVRVPGYPREATP